MKLRELTLMILAIGLTFCVGFRKPTARIYLDEFSYIIRPHISYENSKAYLIYQIDTFGTVLPNRAEVDYNVKGDSGYIFFVGKTSFREYGTLKKIPIFATSRHKNSFKINNVFWLNPDNTKIKIEVK